MKVANIRFTIPKWHTLYTLFRCFRTLTLQLCALKMVNQPTLFPTPDGLFGDHKHDLVVVCFQKIQLAFSTIDSMGF